MSILDRYYIDAPYLNMTSSRAPRHTFKTNIGALLNGLQQREDDHETAALHKACIEYHQMMMSKIRLRTKYPDIYKEMQSSECQESEQHQGIFEYTIQRPLHAEIKKADDSSEEWRAAHDEYRKLLQMEKAYLHLESKVESKDKSTKHAQDKVVQVETIKEGQDVNISHPAINISQNGQTMAQSAYDNVKQNDFQTAEIKQSNISTKFQDKTTVVMTTSDHDSLLKQIADKDLRIAELTTRLSSIAGDKLVGGNPNIADLSDQNRPTKLSEMFGSLYDDEWSDAFEVMKDKGKSENEIIEKLQTVVYLAYEFCESMAATQLTQIQHNMEEMMLNPFSKSANKSKSGKSTFYAENKNPFDPGIRYVKDYRKTKAAKTVDALTQHFREHVIHEKIKWIIKSPEVAAYVNKCVELIWLMCVQDPPMYLHWAEKKQHINTDFFICYKETGTTVKFTVWPAVFLYKGGPVVSKGFVRTK